MAALAHVRQDRLGDAERVDRQRAERRNQEEHDLQGAAGTDDADVGQRGSSYSAANR